MTSQTPTLFQRHIGIDYSGAATPDSRLPGIRVFYGEPLSNPIEFRFGYDWTRRELAHWLVDEINSGIPAIIGIDHGFSFPLAYIDKYNLEHHWPAVLSDFFEHWPTYKPGARVTDIRQGGGKARTGDPRWKRLCEQRARTAKSIFHFGVPGSVAHSTHAGLPWLAHLRSFSKRPIHYWPFDGWTPPPGITVVAEINPSLWRSKFPRPDLTPDQQDAYAASSWLLAADRRGLLPKAFAPNLTPDERKQADLEGWILGIL